MNATRATTMQVATWIAGLTYDDLPERSLNVLRHAVLDTLGCILHGRDMEWARIAADWARAGGAGGPASILGDASPSLRPSDAAFANGIAAHAFELDDFHSVKLHPGAVVVPAALALAEAHDLSGEDLVTAVAAGYEVMIRTSAALDPSAGRLRGWHLTGIAGTFGAAAAGARLLGLDAERTAWALGLAGTQSSGLFAFNADGAMSKRFHAGDAARAGVVAAELAAAGFTGPTQIYEAEDGGFLKAHSDAAREAPLVDGLGSDWRLDFTTFKPYSCCGSLHSYVDAALELRERFGVPDDPERRMRVGLCHLVDVQCGFDYRPSTTLNAQMNARYCVATAFTDGAVLPAQFEPDRLADPRTMALIERIEQVHDPELDGVYPANFCGWVEVESAPGSGAFERVYRHDPSGSIVNPDKDAAMRRKFRMLMADLLPAEQAAAVEATALALESNDAQALVGRLVQPARMAAE